MPLYDFKCLAENCSHEFEEKVSLSEFETKVVQCPKCNKEAKRLLAAQRANHTTWKSWRT